MSFYREWGFERNPFETSPLPSSEEGSQLLVGRDKEIKKLRRRLDNSSKIPTIEGLNGVGKTSLANVMIYRAMSESVNNRVGPIYIPCRQIFQLNPSTTVEDFQLKVLMEIAQTLLDQHKILRTPAGRTRASKNKNLERFLNSAQVKSFTAGAWVVNGGVTLETNTGKGFERSGFEKAVADWLNEVFPDEKSGGVVCVIDNLELLQTSLKARAAIEAFRDTLFQIKGLRWILCGALGIVHGIASSPRLEGRLNKPVVLDDLEERYAPEIFRNRIKAFRSGPRSKLPMSESNFVELFDIMRGNIRSVLNECDEFCSWVADRVEDPEDFEEDFFEEWLQEELESNFHAIRAELRPAALRVFETACQFEAFSPSDCMAFGYETPAAMRPQIKTLETAGLLVSSVDDEDKRRKTIQVTSKGWKVRAYLDYSADGLS
ncbi:MAG: MarR family transcriptional regulator [Fuscovulum sp.]|nr:MAG: MarR family transcriptional regulator [Fuscovulum sp.]